MIEVQDFFFAKDCLDILAECLIAKDREYAVSLLNSTYWLCDLCNDTASMKAIDAFLEDF